MSDADNNFEQLFAVIEKAVLMRIKMRRADTHGVSTVNLGGKFHRRFLWIDARRSSPVVMEITIFIHEPRDFVFRSDRSASVVNAFARKREMQTKIGVWMRFGIISNFREPRARHHDARGIDKTRSEAHDRRRVYRMSYADVIRVDDQELGIAREAQFLSE